MANDLITYITSSGIIVPNTDSVISELQTEWKNLFGSQLSVDSSTPQGRIIETEAMVRKGTLGACAMVANQLNPNQAFGIFLDAHGAFFGVNRPSGRNSEILNVLLTGTPASYPTATITVNENPSANDTLTVSYILNNDFASATESVFIFGASGGVQIGSTTAETATNIANAINANTTLNPSGAATMNAVASSNVVTITATILPSQNSRNQITVSYSLSDSTASDNITSENALNYCYVPAGTVAQATNGELFSLSSGILLDSTGKGYGTFVAQNSGAIVVGVGELTVLVNPPDGLETVYNPSMANVGFDSMSDSQFRVYVQNTKAKYSTGMVESLKAALFDINGLLSCEVIENYTSETLTSNNSFGIPIPEGEQINSHSVMIVVAGGNSTGDFDNLVANAILSKRSGGCGMQPVSNAGNVRNVNITGSDGGSYTMTFNYATPVPIYVYLDVRNNGYGGNVEVAIQEVLLNWFSGNLDIDDSLKIKIGKSISAFEISSILMQNLPIYIPSCYIGTSPNPNTSNEIAISKIQMATITTNNITVNLLS